MKRRSILGDLRSPQVEHLFSRVRYATNKRDHGTPCVAKSVDITKHSTTIVGGKADYEKVEKHIENLKVQIADEANSIEACTRLQERITRLASGIAIIREGLQPKSK